MYAVHAGQRVQHPVHLLDPDHHRLDIKYVALVLRTTNGEGVGVALASQL